MFVRNILQFEIEKHEQRIFNQCVQMVMYPYLRQGEDDERRLLNLLMNDRFIMEPKVEQIKSLLDKIECRIEMKLLEFEELLNNVPDENYDDTIIRNPKIYVQHMIDNYSSQIRMIKECKGLFYSVEKLND